MMRVFVIAIVLVALLLRFFELGNNPPSLSWDEAAWGYNAYTLGKDGRDEFGRFIPYEYLESFGDFKPPLYAYLTVLPVKVFGLNEFATRFASSFFGVLTVLLTYLLVQKIFPDKRKIAALSALLLAISPWHINLSRAAFEANVATFFLVLGVWLFLVSVKKRRWWLVLSLVSFALSLYTFNTARVVAPLLLLGLVVGFRKELLIRKKEFLLAIVVGVLLTTPIAGFLLSPQAQLRFHEVNIFSDLGIIERTNREMQNDGNVWWSRILHNRRFAYSVEYLKHYFDHFNPGSLFIKGDGNPKFSTQDAGQLYLWELPFLVVGALVLLRRREGYWWVVPFWLLIGIMPAATARETPHALRIEATLPTWQILTAYGLIQVASVISNSKYQMKYVLAMYFLFSVFNFSSYVHGYYTHYPREYSQEWQHGYKEAIAFIQSVGHKYDRVVFTEALGRPYIYALFYLKEDPKSFRSTANVFRETYGFVHVREFGKFIFTNNPKDVRISDKRVLYIDKPENASLETRVLKRFTLLNGKAALIAYTL